MKYFWLAGILSGLLFTVLFSHQYGIFNRRSSIPENTLQIAPASVSARNTWKNIFQNGIKIGVSHSNLSRSDSGYVLRETLHLRINTMGMTQNISVDTTGRLHSDLSLSTFSFAISSGRFRFHASGSVNGETLSVITRSTDSFQKQNIRLDRKIYLTAGIFDALMAADSKKTMSVNVFDPATLSQQPVTISKLDDEQIVVMGTPQKTRKLSLNFKGITQYAWMNESGEILREQGLFGITLEKTSREDALFGMPLESSQDLTKIASVPANIRINDPAKHHSLKVKISGISLGDTGIDGGRQLLEGNLLTVNKEILPDTTTPHISILPEKYSEFLKPSVFIQSENPKIRTLALKITENSTRPLDSVKKLMAWIEKNIVKKPVLSLPDALSTLENRMGDCNEHAMLFAALARAIGIPCKVEAGLVYLDGRFYYHAWNAVFVGRWITVDALFAQIPADVTHLRLTSGAQKIELDIMGIIGKINIEIIEVPAASAGESSSG